MSNHGPFVRARKTFRGEEARVRVTHLIDFWGAEFIPIGSVLDAYLIDHDGYKSTQILWNGRSRMVCDWQVERIDQMSWFATATVPKGTDEKDVPGIISAATLTGQPDVEEANTAFRVAASHAASVVVGGVLGNIKDIGFTVQLSGHANPNHVKAGNWAGDCLTIAITQNPEV